MSWIDYLSDTDLLEVKRELTRRGMIGGASFPWRVGECVFIRAVTYHWIGRIAELGPDYILLEGAVWVASSPRLNEMLQSGSLSGAEIEVVPDGQGMIMRAAMVDVMRWSHPLPTVSQ